jgi:Acetyltransferase (GNAT) domain
MSTKSFSTRTRGTSASSFSAEIRFPVRERVASELVPPSLEWLSELREARGRIIYDHGHRPAFRLPDGSFSDPDPLDLDAYHLIVRSQSGFAGCSRVIRLSECSQGAVESALGRQGFSDLLSQLGARRERTCEASRWMVAPEYRRRGLGFYIVAASWAAARWLGLETAFVMAGTRDRQASALVKMGAQPVPGAPLLHSRRLDDDLRLLYFDVLHPSECMRRWTAEAMAVLGLECLTGEQA